MMVSILVCVSYAPSYSSLSLSSRAFLIRLLVIQSDITLFSAAFFFGYLHGFGLLANSWRGFSKGGMRYLISNWVPLFALLMIDLLAMRTWWVCRDIILTCLVVLAYPMKIHSMSFVYLIWYTSQIEYECLLYYQRCECTLHFAWHLFKPLLGWLLIYRLALLAVDFLGS